ncbi:MAG: hypothetical protein WBF58_12070 [Xanthobacteraceae bacterium]
MHGAPFIRSIRPRMMAVVPAAGRLRLSGLIGSLVRPVGTDPNPDLARIEKHAGFSRSGFAEMAWTLFAVDAARNDHAQ